MSVADNILIGTALTRRKRGGTTSYHTGAYEGTVNYPASGTPIRGIYEFWRTAGLSGSPTSDIVLHQGTKFWTIDSRTSVAVDRTGALTINSSAVPCYQPMNQKIYFCSTKTSDGYAMWDGAAASAVLVTDPADGPGKYLCTHFGRMVMAGNDDYPFRLYLSKTLNPEDWSTGDATSLDLDDDGDPEGITGICSFQGRLYAFVRRGIYEITGNTTSTFVVNRISRGIGCLAHASIVQTPNDILFASDRGVHSLKQVSSGRQSESTFLSRDIQKLWTELLNTALYKRCMAMYSETTNNYIISVPSSGQTTNDNLLCFNIEFGTWTVWPSISARSITPVIINNKQEILIAREDGKIALLNQTDRTDLGDGYSARWVSGILYPGAMGIQKRFKSITILSSANNTNQVQIGWEIDGEKSGSKAISYIVGEDVLGSTLILGSSRLGVGQYIPKTVAIDEVGYGIKIDVLAGGTSDIEMFGFILECEDINETYT